MKKLFVILILVTLLGYESIGAEKAPILPRKANNAEYSLSEAKTFVLNYGTVSDWFRSNMLMIINRGLAASGETIKVDDSNMDWIFQHITYEFKDLGPYTNSRLSDGVPEFFQDKDGWSGNIAVFRYGKCVIFLYKTQCMNLLDIPVKIATPPATYNPPPTPGPNVVDTIRTGSVTVVNHIYNNNIISESGNSTNSISAPASAPTEYVITDEPNNNGFTREVGWGPSYQQRQMPIMPRQRMYVEARFDVRGGRQQNYHPQQQPANHASGTGGFKTGNTVYKASGTRGRRN
jgi:hypothetical protein